MNLENPSKVSIQVRLNGYFCKLRGGADPSSVRDSWRQAGRMFTDPDLMRTYDSVEVSLLTPKVALVPSSFFDPGSVRSALEATVVLGEDDEVAHVAEPEFDAELVYSLSIGEALSGAIARTVKQRDGGQTQVLPEMHYILRDIRNLKDHNRIVTSYADGFLHLAIAQGGTLLLANVYEAADFTTAEYFIFLAIKKLQLNPEASAIHFRTPVTEEEEMSLYRYFKAVERL